MAKEVLLTPQQTLTINSACGGVEPCESSFHNMLTGPMLYRPCVNESIARASSWVPRPYHVREMAFLWHTPHPLAFMFFTSILLQCSLRLEVSGITAGHLLMSWNRDIRAMSMHKAFSGTDWTKWHSLLMPLAIASHLYHKVEVWWHTFYLW